MHRSLAALVSRLPATVGPALGPSLDSLQHTALDIVSPLFRAVMEAIEERLLRMHGWAGYGSDGAGDDVLATSPHAAEAAALLADFRAEYLSKFVPAPSPNTTSCAGALVERMACRTLVFFVRHAALLRPLSQSGKLQVAKDLAELQAAVGQQLYPLEQLGQPYRAVKAFRALLFTPAAGVASSPLLAELPPIITLHHLFSRLPASIQAPHERSGLTPLQYSLWLDGHTHEEALRSIRGALQAAPASAAGGGDVDGEVAEALRAMAQLCAGAP